jgi:uncharacterized membrane protein YvbJ
MLCINCNKQTPDGEVYCHHCGVKLDLTFDQVKEKMGTDIRSERQKKTEDFCRWLLVLTIFLLVTGWLFNRLWSDPPQPTLSPGYLPVVKIPAHWHELAKPIILPE